MRSIYFYWPNLVGYLRLVLLFYGLYVAAEAPVVAALCFFSNLLLDALDGFLARALNQTSFLGAALDYVIDRISFADYAILLGAIYPQYVVGLCFLVSVDLASHFFHWKASVDKSSHKEIAASEPLFLRLYYKRFVLGAACLSHDLFFITLYLDHFYPSVWTKMILFFTLPGLFFKTIVHFLQIFRAAVHLKKLNKDAA